MRAKFITVKYYSDGSGEPVVGIHHCEESMLNAVCDTMRGDKAVVIMLQGRCEDGEPDARIIYSDLITED